MSETVDHPLHYGGDTVYEAVKIIEAWGLGFHLGNTVKYISRVGKKDPDKEIEDLEKAAWYLKRYTDMKKKEKSPVSNGRPAPLPPSGTFNGH